MDISTLVADAASQYGDRIAIEADDATLTFTEVAHRVTRIANGLAGLGLSHGDRILDLQTNSAAYVITDLAIRSGGFVRAALNHRLHPSDWERIARDSGARGLVVDAAHLEKASGVRNLVDVVVVVGDAPGQVTLD